MLLAKSQGMNPSATKRRPCGLKAVLKGRGLFYSPLFNSHETRLSNYEWRIEMPLSQKLYGDFAKILPTNDDTSFYEVTK